jgi:hypothetical protein
VDLELWWSVADFGRVTQLGSLGRPCLQLQPRATVYGCGPQGAAWRSFTSWGFRSATDRQARPGTRPPRPYRYRALGNLFDLQDLGVNEVKGLAEPVRAWTALRPSALESRFGAARGPADRLVASHCRITDILRPRPPSLSGIENGAPISCATSSTFISSLIFSSLCQARVRNTRTVPLSTPREVPGAGR